MSTRYDATKEFTKVEASEKTSGHPRPRTGATAKKRKRETERQLAAKSSQAAVPAVTKKKK